MRIISLDLENIKSYRRAAVDFTPGLNAICGLNGSGKTTLLEAIGFALFDYLPYNHQAFVREGEKTGTIRVRVLGKDERVYEVVRKVGASSTYYVVDAETGVKIVDQRKSVLEWIRTAFCLDVEGESHLEALFKDAVGVPQGLMTAEFQVTDKQRKAVFDPLLRVEEYRNAYDNLRDTASHLRDQTATKREEMARLESETEAIPAKSEEQTRLQAERGESAKQKARLAAELDETATRKDVLDGVEDQLRLLKSELERKQSEVRNCEAMLVEQEKAAQSAEEARRAVEASEPGFQKVQAARERLAELEVQRQERDRINAAMSDVKAAMHGIYGGIQRLDDEFESARAAADRAAALVDAVARQDDLERRRHEARLQLQEARELDEQMDRLRAAITDLERARTEREARLAEARVAQTETERLAELEEELRQAGEQMAALGPLKRQLGDLKAEGRQLRQQSGVLAAEVARREELLRRIAEQEPLAEPLDSLLLTDQELRDERARALATLEYQTLARTDLFLSSACPLLEVQCPVVAADPGIADRFDTRVGQLAERAQQLEAELASVSARLEEARSARASCQQLQLQAAQLEKSPSQLEEIDRNLQRCREQYQELSAVVAAEQELRSSHAELDKQVRRLKAASRLAAQLALLEEQQERDGAGLEAARQTLARLQERRQALGAVDQQARSLDEELRSLGDPRAEQQGLLGVAQRRAEVEASLQREQARLAAEADRLKALVASLQPFKTLDAELEEQREIERNYDGDWKRYLSSRDEAMQLDERRRAVVATTRALEEARSGEQELRRQLDETASHYDAEQHRWLRARCEELGRELAGENMRHHHLSEALARVEEELAYLQRQEEKLATYRAELDELARIICVVNDVRETIKSAGPAITETLLSNISQVANDIYAEIMDDHAAELRWDRDYDVLVQRGPETRRFAQLSGGEQMSAALAVRLALLKEMSEVDFAFFDEPTQNMDGDRRANLAAQIRAVKGFDQLIVISHDDTFEHHTDNLVRLRKVHEETEVEAG